MKAQMRGSMSRYWRGAVVVCGRDRARKLPSAVADSWGNARARDALQIFPLIRNLCCGPSTAKRCVHLKRTGWRGWRRVRRYALERFSVHFEELARGLKSGPGFPLFFDRFENLSGVETARRGALFTSGCSGREIFWPGDTARFLCENFNDGSCGPVNAQLTAVSATYIIVVCYHRPGKDHRAPLSLKYGMEALAMAAFFI